MDAQLIFGAVGAVVGLAGLIFGGITVRKLIDTTTAADRDRAAARVNAQIQEARDDERQKCEQARRTAEAQQRANERRLLDQLTEMTSDRDTERQRANALQALINQQRLRGPDD